MTGLQFDTLLKAGKRAKIAYSLGFGQLYIRPLTDWEFDDIDLQMLNQITDRKTKDYMIRLRFGKVELTDEELDGLDFGAVQKARVERTYWILLRSCCDFYDDLSFDAEGLGKIKKIPGAVKATAKVLELSGRTRKSQEDMKSFRQGSLSDQSNVKVANKTS